MSTEEAQQLIELDQTFLTETETHEKEEAQKQEDNSADVKQSEEKGEENVEKNEGKVEEDEEDKEDEQENNQENEKANEDGENEKDEENGESSSDEEPLSTSSDSSSENEDVGENEEKVEESEEDVEHSCSVWLSLIGFTFLIFLVLFGIVTFFPKSSNSETQWILYANKCCKTYHGQTRCLLDLQCKSRLKRWIDFQPLENRSSYINRCCYLYAPYDHSYFFAKYYCDPLCLKPRLL